MNRYATIPYKNAREIVLLRGSGCRWSKCRFCDYHADQSTDTFANISLNHKILSQVSGIYHSLEVVNSGSFSDLPQETINEIIDICQIKDIRTLHVECHWLDLQKLIPIRKEVECHDITMKVKGGIETFDINFRTKIMNKGIPPTATPEKLAAVYDECCLLFGLEGQSLQQMFTDVSIGLTYFERICINIFCNNSTNFKQDRILVDAFMNELYPILKDNPRVDILLNNTDFNIG